jgi:hypothetical protein
MRSARDRSWLLVIGTICTVDCSDTRSAVAHSFLPRSERIVAGNCYVSKEKRKENYFFFARKMFLLQEE